MASHFKIVVPFYNVEKWIKICIRSIKAQDYKDFQCILLDDMSTDNTANIVREEIGNDPRFTFVEVQEKAFALKNIYLSQLTTGHLRPLNNQWRNHQNSRLRGLD